MADTSNSSSTLSETSTPPVSSAAVEEGSAAQQAQSILSDSTVVGAFHNVSAVLLENPEVASVDTDVLVLGDVREATDLVQDLAGSFLRSGACMAAGCATPTRWRR